MIKNLIIILFVINFILQPMFISSQVKANDSENEIIQGQIELNDNTQKNIFTGETTTLKKGTSLKMTVSSVLSSGLSVEGDEFFAEVTDELTVSNGVVIPSGTIAHGKVKNLGNSKRLGRDAYINLNFDYLITPDGREIPIEASMTTKRNPVTSTAKVLLEDTAYTVTGGLIGGILALKYLGLGAAVASNGYTVAGGAGVGAIAGGALSLARKGSDVLLAPGDIINVKVQDSLNLPIISEDALKEDELLLNGLTVQVNDYKLEKDPFGELNTITLNLNIDNKSSKTFSSFDMALVNDYKSVYYPSVFGNTDLWFRKITPNTKLDSKVSFSVDNPKRKFWLIFLDTSTRKPLAKISLYNVKRNLQKNTKTQKH